MEKQKKNARVRGRGWAKIRGGHATREEMTQFLREGVCGGCPMEAECDTPCRAYLYWYDRRTEAFRRQLTGKPCDYLARVLPVTESW